MTREIICKVLLKRGAVIRLWRRQDFSSFEHVKMMTLHCLLIVYVAAYASVALSVSSTV